MQICIRSIQEQIEEEKKDQKKEINGILKTFNQQYELDKQNN